MAEKAVRKLAQSDCSESFSEFSPVSTEEARETSWSGVDSALAKRLALPCPPCLRRFRRGRLELPARAGLRAGTGVAPVLVPGVLEF